MRKTITVIILIATIISSQIKAQELNTIESLGGVVLSANYSIAPISSMAPTPHPLSMFGVGLSFITNETVQLGVYANKSLPSANYYTGYTLTADTIDIDYTTRDIKIGLAYLFYVADKKVAISPSIAAGIGDMKIDRVDYYDDERKTPLEEAFLINTEIGLNGSYIIQGSFMLSIGVSYVFSVPDRLLINSSSKEMNMLKFNAGLSFGIISGGGGKNKRRKRRR